MQIPVPSVILSIAVGAVNGYALAFWRFRARTSSSPSCWSAPSSPTRCFIYPLVRIFSKIGIYNTLLRRRSWCTSIFGLPMMTLLFRNYLRVAADRAVQGGARRRRRLLARSSSGSCCRCRRRSSSSPSSCRSPASGTTILFGLIFAGRENLPMTVQLNNIVNSTQGERAYNVDMAATILTGAGAARRLFRLRHAGSCAASPPAR